MITTQGQEMKKALEAGDLKTVGTIMTTNHKLLAEMEFSHEILDKMCKSALEEAPGERKLPAEVEAAT